MVQRRAVRDVAARALARNQGHHLTQRCIVQTPGLHLRRYMISKVVKRRAKAFADAWDTSVGQAVPDPANRRSL